MWIELENADGTKTLKPHFFVDKQDKHGYVRAVSLCGRIKIWDGGNEDDNTSYLPLKDLEESESLNMNRCKTCSRLHNL